ncbi:M1 family metallopeptidase [Sedimenticola sp.]|uniref:M1 family metallopeptidase n=1 Tax=Sedimenticola sp. TaxID=1940285 RepID=UPI003D0DDBD3
MRSLLRIELHAGHVIRRLIPLLLLFVTTTAFSIDSNQPVHHQLQIEIQPESGTLIATDQIRLPNPEREVEFLLHADLTPTLNDKRAHLASMEWLDGTVPLRRYRILTSTPTQTFTLTYRGTIAHHLAQQGERGSSRQSTPGLISKEGVFLAGTSYWYPQIGASTLTFHMQIRLPPGWQSISQGNHLPNRSGWEENHPQEEIYLIASPYHRYKQTHSGHLAEVYLHDPDPALAKRYLDATGLYLAMYEQLLGPYPYSKFSLVENFWESGYGMPSFTLLGPQVIQLPFIIHTSYPHEVLHNWWGNGVYVDLASGNWSEGLTTYLADHLLREQQGDGAGYRRTTLQNYANYVAQQDDFPLTQFRGNHGQISQSVGYGKTLMLFHMLRIELGDHLFRQGLQQFYRDYRFKTAGYRQIQAVFETVSGKTLDAFFKQWLTRTGAPTLKLVSVEAIEASPGYRLRIMLRQTQPEAPYHLTVPIYVHFSDGKPAVPYRLEMDKRDATLEIHTDQRPLKVSVDPLFDLFRRLDSSETPSSLGQLFGAKQVIAIVPEHGDSRARQAYRQLISQWQQQNPGLMLIEDSHINKLPIDKPIWILGSENRFAHLFDRQLDAQGLQEKPGTLALTLTRQAPRQTLGYISTDNPAALSGLARKLPHYGRYSYALFYGDRPDISQRGTWRVTDNALSVLLSPPATTGTSLPEISDHRPLIDPVVH